MSFAENDIRTVCVAGKNNIAIEVLKYLYERNQGRYSLCVLYNKTETGENSCQRSFSLYVKQLGGGVKICQLADLYKIENLIFLSMEFDQLVKPELFCQTAQLFNIHFSLLPSYKGMYTSALPILFGERFAGVTFHMIDRGIDTGDIIDQRKFEIKDNYTCRDLYAQYIQNGTQLVLDNIENVLSGNVKARRQNAEGSSYYSKKTIDYSNIVIDLNQTAKNIQNQIRAFSFREYQMPNVYDHDIIKAEITTIKSMSKAGSVVCDTEMYMMISSVDYNVVLFYDRLFELLDACKNGEIQKVKEICCVREHVNASGEKGWTPLMVATYHNRVEIVKYLIALGADVYAKNYNGTNILMYAKDAFLHTGDATLMKLYLQLGLKAEDRDYRGKNLYDYINLLSDVEKKEVQYILRSY